MIFAPPLRVTALVPRKTRGEIKHCAAFWSFVAADGRAAVAWAASLDDAAQLARVLLPGPGEIELTWLRSEVGTPLM
jgi:hypothetical protein